MSQDTQHVIVDADGSLFTEPPSPNSTQDTESSSPHYNNFTQEEMPMDSGMPPSSTPKGIDPAIYVIVAFALIMIVYYLFYKKNQKKREEREAFFRELDGDKVKCTGTILLL
jgi:hypothetical protein